MIIENLPIISPADASEKLSKARGLYFWIDRKEGDIVYIGSAVGSGGLKRKIVTQQLNSSYLDFTQQPDATDDSYQLQHGVLKMDKNGVIVRGIDKSTFRKSLGRSLRLMPGTGTVSYIMENLSLRVFVSDDIGYIQEMKHHLIARYRPVFNTVQP